MRLYLVRHGQSVHNASGMRQNSTSPLSELGITQAESLADRLSRIKCDALVSSTFTRARQTAEIVSKKINMEVSYSDIFVERKRPTEIELKHQNDPEVIRINTLLRENVDIKDWHYSDEENFADIVTRARKGVEYLENIGKHDVILISHGTYIKSMLCVMAFGTNFDSQTYYALLNFLQEHNTGITECVYEGNKWSMLTWNDYAHLG